MTRGVLIGSMIVFICLTIMLQVLGVPATLLDPDGFHDVMEASVLEGFSIPSFSDLPGVPPVWTLLPATELWFPVTLFDHSLFHPPAL